VAGCDLTSVFEHVLDINFRPATYTNDVSHHLLYKCTNNIRPPQPTTATHIDC